MNAERLLKHYETIADAPDAIARLRRLIVDLAVRGKLLSQDPNDEPAAELVKRIAKEKLRLVEAGTIRKGILSAPIGEDELPFDLPRGWAWTRLGDLIHLVSGQHLQPSEYSEDPKVGLPYITGPSDFAEEGLQITRFALIRKAVAKKGQLLLTVKGSGVGKTTTCDIPEVAISRQLMALTAIAWDDRFLVLITHRLAETLQEEARSLIPGISREDVEEFVFSLPPLAEQHRIVAKVDELMALCERLETARTSREARRDRLAAATLARLNAPDPETFQADARFALDALSALTTRPDQIRHLRQTILNLAVRGKLVRQDAEIQCKEVELESLVKIVRGSSPRPKGDPRYYGGPVPRLLIADITRDGKYVTPQLDNLTDEGAKLSRPMPKGSLVLAISGSYGVPAFLAVDACIHDGFIGFRDVSNRVDPEYLYLVMQFRRPYFDDVVKDSGLKNLTTEHLKRLAVPLFPLEEQHRIVAKVDELMALCDRLEASLTASAATRRRLLDALLAEALAPAEDRKLEAAE